jgi:hypothetical protein
VAADFSPELSASDRYFFKREAEKYPDAHGDPEGRYSFYRRRGHSRGDSVAYVLAWMRNTNAQGARRLAHGTGATTPSRAVTG